METTSCSVTTHEKTAWPLVGLLLDALTHRDFDAMQSLFAADVRFRALIPPGTFELHTANEAAATFRSWFGGEDEFEILDASLGHVGTRLYARWLARMSPPGRPAESRTAEQHVFTTGTECIETIDLLCSGFQKETP
jgi:hypothetical protein